MVSYQHSLIKVPSGTNEDAGWQEISHTPAPKDGPPVRDDNIRTCHFEPRTCGTSPQCDLGATWRWKSRIMPP